MGLVVGDVGQPDSEEEFDVGIDQLSFDIMKLDYFHDGLKGR